MEKKRKEKWRDELKLTNIKMKSCEKRWMGRKNRREEEEEKEKALAREGGTRIGMKEGRR